MKTPNRILISITGLVAVAALAVAAAPAGAQEALGPPGRERARVDYSRPSPPRDVAGGTFLGAVGSGLRLLRVENPAGAPGCEGAPRPNLRAVTTGGDQDDLFDPAPGVTLSAGGNAILTGGRHVAIVTFCEGFLDEVWLAEAAGTRLVNVRAMPGPDFDPTGQFMATALSRDGRRLLAVHTTGEGLEGHEVKAIDTATGAVTDLGVGGYWAGELADGTLVVDQGDRVRIGDRTVPVPNPPGAGRFLAISPEGRRVAFANVAGLRVLASDGTTTTWTTEPVRGAPAWSPDGFALAYATGDGESLTGELRVVTAGSDPRTAAAPVITFLPVGFAADRSVTALLATAPGTDPTDPFAGHVIEVTFPRTRDGGLPTSTSTYVDATLRAWRTGDGAALDRLTEPPVAALLTDRPPRAGETWSGPVCEGAAGSSYCTVVSSAASLTIRVLNEAAALGRDHAVIEAAFGAPPGGVALWPLTTAEAAANTQEQVDQGHSPWMLEPEAVADSFARAELGWAEVEVTVVDPARVRVNRPGAPTAVILTLSQPARTGPGGIWVVTRANSATS